VWTARSELNRLLYTINEAHESMLNVSVADPERFDSDPVPASDPPLFYVHTVSILIFIYRVSNLVNQAQIIL